MNARDERAAALAARDRHESAVRDLGDLLENTGRRLGLSAPHDADVALAAVSAAILPRWRQLVGAAAGASRALRDRPEEFDQCRRLARSRLLPLLIAGPIWHRSYHKPRGYPGDYGVMNFVYDQADEGPDPYARLCHRLGLDVGACVRTRLQFVVDELAARMGVTGTPLRVLSLGCGSAREIAPAIALGTPRRAVELTLLDHDLEALDAARRAVEPAVASCPGPPFETRYEAVSFSQVLRDARFTQQWQKQDVVYCMGLADYVPDERLQPLVSALFALVADGGSLILGNMKEPSDTFWALDFILDWPLVYRTERAMRDLAASMQASRTQLLLEETGNNFVLKLRKH